MDSIIALLKGFIATVSIAVLSLFTQTPEPIPTGTTVIEEPTTGEYDYQPIVESTTTPKTNPAVEAYKLGKLIGTLEEQVTQIEKKVSENKTQPAPSPAPVPIPQPVPQPTPVVQPSPSPIEPLPVTQPKQSMSSLTIFSPVPTKGLNREFRTTDELNENQEMYNEVLIGLICRNDEGLSVKDAQVAVVATDSTQNKTINGTGNLIKLPKSDGGKDEVYYYPYTYQFKTTGKHTITFTCNGMSESVDLEVSDPA